jgi:GT2 family glycosyltransferase
VSSLRVGLVVIAYNQPVWTERLVDSARASKSDVAVHLFLHSKEEATTAACERLAARAEVRYYPYGENRGVSRSWNDGILTAFDEGADAVVVANDDVLPAAGDLDRLAEKAVRCSDRYIVSCAGPHERLGRLLPSHGYSFFAVNPVAIETIGCFDENFFPAYCEDQDYARRAGLAGLSEENCADTTVLHAGSSAIFASPELALQNAITQRHNIAYYMRKWGGDAGSERFETPFGKPDFGLRIAREDRAAPYGAGYDRTDRHLVAF